MSKQILLFHSRSQSYSWTPIAAVHSTVCWLFSQAIRPPCFVLKLFSHLEFCMSQHCRLGEAVPALHQVNHIQHGQEGQGDVDVAAGAGTLQVQDVVVGSRGGIVVSTERYGGGAENVHATQSAPGERGEAAVHEEGQEEALPVGLPTQRGGQRLLDWPLLWRQRERRDVKMLQAAH